MREIIMHLAERSSRLFGSGSSHDDKVAMGLDNAIVHHRTSPISISETSWKRPVCLGVPSHPAAPSGANAARWSI